MKIDFFLDRDINEKATQHSDKVDWKDIVKEVIAQRNSKLDEDATKILTDNKLIDWMVNQEVINIQAITDISLSLLDNREPLLVNNVSTWDLRPDASCDIDNLFFASDYVRTYTDLATMEGANEAARRAVNCLLDTDKNHSSKCKIWPLHEPIIFSPFKWYDQRRWEKGLPWSLHIPWWLEVLMVPWTVACFIEGIFQFLFGRILKLF